MQHKFPNVHQSDHPLIQHKLAIIRDVQTSSRLFRESIHEISTILAVEATAGVHLTTSEVDTPLTRTEVKKIDDRIAIIPILRAGLGMSEPILRLIPEASVRHLGFYRDESTLKPVHYYDKLPKECLYDLALIVDPMLATGGSAIAAIDRIKEWGVPKIIFISVISAPEGIERVIAAHGDIQIYTASIDEKLTKGDERWPDGFIWPGLGDAGDRLHDT